MSDELVKRYQQNGIVYVPDEEYMNVKRKLDESKEQYDVSYDNSFKYYIFEAKRGTLI